MYLCVVIHFDEKLLSKDAEKAILVGAFNQKLPREKSQEYLDELALLANTAGAKVIKVFMQSLEKPIPATYVGKGKLEEIAKFIEESGADLVIFDDDLTPSQVKNIDAELKVKVLDRTGIILHIFSERARSAQARAQVELAQLQYMLPRLAGLWTHLSRQKGGIGMKGAGEREIETDRRIIRTRIDQLKDLLKKIDKQNQTRRKGRNELVRVALVGYTNAGKSTLMNLLSKSNVLAENKLFATLDATVRKVVLEGVPFLLSDTVGFIRKLPSNLVECFKSTLDEVRESDILLHVVDVSNAVFQEQIDVVNQTLVDMGVKDKPIIMVFNKVDQLDEEMQATVNESFYAREHAPSVFISAEKRGNVVQLRSMIMDLVREMYKGKFPIEGQIQDYKNWTEGY
jgi:GTPase